MQKNSDILGAMSRILVVGCRIKANCPNVGTGPKGGVPSLGVFISDSSPRV